MAVTEEQVHKTATLARLDLAQGQTPEEARATAARMAAQLDAIVGYMDILNEVNTEGVEPLYSPMLHVAPPRRDVAQKRFTPQEILANAPQTQDNFFAVPPVI